MQFHGWVILLLLFSAMAKTLAVPGQQVGTTPPRKLPPPFKLLSRRPPPTQLQRPLPPFRQSSRRYPPLKKRTPPPPRLKRLLLSPRRPPPAPPSPPPAPRPPPPSGVAKLLLSRAVVSQAPYTMGVGLGHRNMASNAAAWHEFMGANSGRLFITPFMNLYTHIMGPASSSGFNFTRWGRDLNGAYVVDSKSYMAAIKLLRTPPGRDPRFRGFANPISYSSYDKGLSSGNGVGGNAADSVTWLNRVGSDMMVVLPGGCGTNTGQPWFNFTTQTASKPAYWKERWELYKSVYAMGRWAFLRGVVRIEIYNEPELDQKWGCALPAAWLDHMRIRPAALRAVFDDMNADTGAGLQIFIGAAPFIVAAKYYGSLAQLTVQNLHTSFPSGIQDASVTNFDEFAHHTYGKFGGGMLRDCLGLRESVGTDSYVPYFSLSEYNSDTTPLYDKSPLTANDATSAAMLAVQTLNAIQCADSLYMYKFSMTYSATSPASGTSKNGVHYASNSQYPYNVGDSTRSAEAWRLIAGVVKGRFLLGVIASFPTSNRQGSTQAFTDGAGCGLQIAVAVSDGVNRYLLVGNNHPLPLALSINLAGWNLAVGSPVLATELSSTRYGELAPLQTVTSARLLSYTMPPQSLVRFTIPVAKSTRVTLLPSDDTVLRAGSFQGASLLGTEPTLTVATSATSNQEGTRVVLLKFNLRAAGVAASKVQAAVLSLHVNAAGSGLNQFLVLGIRGWKDSWSQSSATWSAHPNLFPLNSGTRVNSVGSNFLRWNGTEPGPQIVGHITFSGRVAGTAADFRSIEVTPFISQPGSGVYTFMIVRTFRADPSCVAGIESPVPCYGPVPGDSLTSSFLKFDSRESRVPSFRPTLTLYRK